MMHYTLRLWGLVAAGLLMAAVMADAGGYRWCDQYSDPNCVSVTHISR